MSIRMNSVNPRPRLAEHLVRAGAFRKSPVLIVDIGARGAAGKEWKIYGDQYAVIGFEADREECIRLNKSAPKHERYIPTALWSKKGKRRFFIHQKHPPTSSFYDSNGTFLSRFPGWEPWMPTKSLMLETTDFASAAKKNGIRSADVMKLDTEGADLDILKGVGKSFEDKLICVCAEAYFAAWGKGMPLFADMDTFMRARGFVLFDLPVMRWEKRPTSPYMFTDGIFGPTDRGQPVLTQALYLKDAVADFKVPARRKKWNDVRILKLASLMELFRSEDSAIELLQEAAANGFLGSYDVEAMIDLLTPQLDGKDVTYEEFVAMIKRDGPPRYISGRRVSQKEYAEYLKEKKRLKA